MPFGLVGLSLGVNFVLEMLQLGGEEGKGREGKGRDEGWREKVRGKDGDGRVGKGWNGRGSGWWLKWDGKGRGKLERERDGLGSCHAERSRSICTVVYEQILRLRSG
ncbi:hypothetical protein [Sphingobacterium sp. 1.A.4]|uniref:hypothetical protein n=1 Tax=Sphingobacterium sp. 1.A.4 TaxID=2044603 RepID=UPI000C0BD39A|nr:hypothetical protein [Sphingobacterium sp. 1.A.4]